MTCTGLPAGELAGGPEREPGPAGNQPGRHGGRVPAGLRARTVPRPPAVSACIWHNQMIGAPAKRSLIARDHR